MGIIWCVCEKIQDFSSDTYSLERGGHTKVYRWLAKYCLDNREFGGCAIEILAKLGV